MWRMHCSASSLVHLPTSSHPRPPSYALTRVFRRLSRALCRPWCPRPARDSRTHKGPDARPPATLTAARAHARIVARPQQLAFRLLSPITLLGMLPASPSPAVEPGCSLDNTSHGLARGGASTLPADAVYQLQPTRGASNEFSCSLHRSLMPDSLVRADANRPAYALARADVHPRSHRRVPSLPPTYLHRLTP
jgi:hypothetical protein